MLEGFLARPCSMQVGKDRAGARDGHPPARRTKLTVCIRGNGVIRQGGEGTDTVGAALGGGSPLHSPVRSPSGNSTPPDPQELEWLPGSIEQDDGGRQPTQSPSSLSPCPRLLLPDPQCGQVGNC